MIEELTLKLKYISTKIDNYNNEVAYFVLEEKSKELDKLRKQYKSHKFPVFEGKDNTTLLKIKTKYINLPSLPIKKNTIVKYGIHLESYSLNDDENVGFYVSKLFSES